MSTHLAGRVAIVTGGSSGIGEAVAHKLGAAGALVAVIASNGRDKAEAVAKAIGNGARGYVCDVRDADAVAALVRTVETELGPVDILVNSAGVFYPTVAGETAAGDVDRMVDINLKGTFHALNAVAAGMKQRRRGWIVNIASCAGIVGVVPFSLYSATKAAVVMLTKAAGRELAPFGIHVNAVAPGNTATPMNAAIRTEPEHKAIYDVMKSITPSQTVFTDPADIAGGALFLVSEAARPMYGAVLQMDEGVTTGI
jgi:3-oxoacyl-[acyl-carrier protein] reductase